MMIRYFAETLGDTGNVAFEYLMALLRIGQVRLVGAPVLVMGGRWTPCSRLMATPMSTPYVNVVCCLRSNWVRTMRVEMPNLDTTGNVVSTEPASQQVELYTHGVRNVLIANDPPPPQGPFLATAKRYQEIVVPTLELGRQWRAVDCHPRVIPVPVFDHASMRAVVTPP